MCLDILYGYVKWHCRESLLLAYFIKLQFGYKGKQNSQIDQTKISNLPNIILKTTKQILKTRLHNSQNGSKCAYVTKTHTLWSGRTDKRFAR
jgi:hypothetical protein